MERFDIYKISRVLNIPLLRYTLFIGILVYVGYLLAEQIQRLDLSQVLPDMKFLAGAALFEILVRFFVGVGFFALLKGFGSALSLPLSVSVAWVCGIGRYLPGKVGLLAGAVYLLKGRGVGVAISSMVPLISTLATVLVGLGLSPPLLPQCNGAYAFVGAGIAGIILFSSLWVIKHVPLSKRSTWIGALQHLSPHGIMGCLICVLAQSICAGAVTWMVCRSLVPIAPGLIGDIIFISAFSGVMGLVAFFAPGGIGVREGLYLVLLGRIIGMEHAAVIALLLRLIQTGTDVLTACTGGIFLKFDSYRKRDAVSRGQAPN